LDRRSDFKRVKSATNVDDPSHKLVELYDPSSNRTVPQPGVDTKRKENEEEAEISPKKTSKKSGGKKTPGKKKKAFRTPKKKTFHVCHV